MNNHEEIIATVRKVRNRIFRQSRIINNLLQTVYCKSFNQKNAKIFIADSVARPHMKIPEENMTNLHDEKNELPLDTVELLPEKNVTIGLAIRNLTENSIALYYLIRI